jgi:hypothetical protein
MAEEKAEGLADQEKRIIELPKDYQKYGMEGNPEPDEYGEVNLDEVDIATVEDILGMSENLPRKWIYLSALGKKVEIEAVTDKERQEINKSAKKKFNKRTKKMETDADDVLYRLIRRKVINPRFPSEDLISKLPVGDVAYIVKEINKLSGITAMTLDDALE